MGCTLSSVAVTPQSSPVEIKQQNNTPKAALNQTATTRTHIKSRGKEYLGDKADGKVEVTKCLGEFFNFLSFFYIK